MSTPRQKAKAFMKSLAPYQDAYGNIDFNLDQAFLIGYETARQDFSKDQDFITKEYFKGYNAALENIKNYVAEVAPDHNKFKILVMTRVLEEDGSERPSYQAVPFLEALDKYIDSVRNNYTILENKLSGKKDDL